MASPIVISPAEQLDLTVVNVHRRNAGKQALRLYDVTLHREIYAALQSFVKAKNEVEKCKKGQLCALEKWKRYFKLLLSFDVVRRVVPPPSSPPTSASDAPFSSTQAQAQQEEKGAFVPYT